MGQFLDANALDQIAASFAPVTLGRGSSLLPRRVESNRLALRSVEQVGASARLVYDARPTGGGDGPLPPVDPA